MGVNSTGEYAYSVLSGKRLYLEHEERKKRKGRQKKDGEKGYAEETSVSVSGNDFGGGICL